MAHGYNTKLVHIKKYPGDGYYYIICDVCGAKIRKKDAVYIRDRYNLQNRLLVCKKDADKENPQSRPYKAREYKAPKLVRPEPTDQYISNLNSSQVPGPPIELRAFLDPLTNVVDLSWIGPNNSGPENIIGYIIYRAQPQLGSPIVIDNNTLSGASFYQDISADYTQYYSYWVSAINSNGTGPMSLPAFYPVLDTDQSINYLLTSQGAMLSTSQGQYIVVNY